METYNAHNFTRGAALNTNVARARRPLSNEEIARACPSALAVAPHDSRSDRYKYIPTVAIIDRMRDAGFQPVAATQSLTRFSDRKDFTKHMIRFSPSVQTLVVGEAFPEIVVVNSHDGSSAYKIMSGWYRYACSNGLIVCESQQAEITVMHKGNIEDLVVDGSQHVLEGQQKTAKVIDAWQTLQLTNGEQEALADAARTIRFGENVTDDDGNVVNVKVDTPITARQLLDFRRYDDNKPDLWHTFNRIQENVTKGGLHGVRRTVNERTGRREQRRMSTREIKGIDQDVKLNRALWQLADNMAKLKGYAAA